MMRQNTNESRLPGITSPAMGLLTAALLITSGCSTTAGAQPPAFTLSSTDLANGTFADRFVLNGFGCSGGNVSPALQWTNLPAGTKSLALELFDRDAPTGSGFWHWAVYNIPGDATGLAQGAGNNPALLPSGAFAGSNDFFDTGATGGNGNYGGPCPPQGDAPHRYTFTLYALSVDKLEVAGGIPRTGTAALYGFVLNKGVGKGLLGKTTLTVNFSR